MNNTQTIANRPYSIWRDGISHLWHFAKGALRLVFRHPITGTSIIPILDDGRVVLIRRRDTGQWALPGGMVEWGEDITTTIKRELIEETGLELLDVRRLVGVYSSPNRDPRFHSICIAIAVNVKGNLKVQDQYEINDVQAFNIADIPLEQLAFDNSEHLKSYILNQTQLA